ncbi:MAG: 50S ribosomal protein L15 [Rickettsiaceae bacterium]|nr:50S ribosomal protein L15 [Rickettsiaceae bacterium]
MSLEELAELFALEPVHLSNLYNIPGSKKVSKRLGRGIGSGKGKTSGRGTKGQKARSGVAIKGFEGGQMPIIARLPKRGFNPLERKKVTPVNIYVINQLYQDGVIKEDEIINNELLKKCGLIKKVTEKVKLLGNDSLASKFKFELESYSKKATEIISAAN